MTGVQEAKGYFHTVGSKLIDYYKENWNKLSCFCCGPLVLCQSRSEKNPGRIYFTCKGKQCNFFQWGDEKLSPKNRQWLECCGDEVKGNHSSPDKNDYPRTGYHCLPTYPPGYEKEYSGRDPLWEDVQGTKFCLVDRTNEIVSPSELYGLHYSRDKEDKMRHLLYHLRSFQAKNPSMDPIFHNRIVSLALTG